jgi:RNA polymerase sigma-70 factor, ECF subfamily
MNDTRMSNLARLVRLPVVQNTARDDTSDQRLAEALRRLRPTLTKRARAIVRNYSDAEDVVQESAARAWDARARLRPGSDPGPWLSAIVRRVAIDLVRQARRYEKVVYADFSANHPSAEDRLIQSEAVAAVSGAATRLATVQRRVLFMHDYVGFTNHEIARLEGVPYHTVRTRLRRARQSVRDRLEGVI